MKNSQKVLGLKKMKERDSKRLKNKTNLEK